MRKTVSESDWKDGFLFLGNQLALDFVNTRPVQDGRPTELLRDFDAVLRWFRAADLLGPTEVDDLRRQWGGSAEASKATEAIKALREQLRTDVLSWEHSGTIRSSTIEEVNRLLANHPMRTRLTAEGKKHSTQLWFERRQPKDLLAPLAYSVADLFVALDRKRVRKCDQCALHFHDTSKKGTRRWCSMQLCGNRVKVAAYAARRRRRGYK